MTVAVPLKRLARINERSLPESTDPRREILYVDIGSVGRGRLVKEPEPMRFSEAPLRARRLVRQGDTIVSTVRTYLRAVWPVRGAVDDLVVSTGFAVLRPTGIDPSYFSWWARSDTFIEEVVARSVGVSYPAINASELGDLLIRVPNLPEQRTIASFLDVETGRIDALISKKRRLIDLLTERRQALITSAMISELALSERVALRRFVTCLDGQRVPLNATERAENPGDYPYWGANGVVDSVGGFLFDEELVLLGEDGAPFDDQRRDVAFCVNGRIWVNNHIHVLKPKAGTDPRYLTYGLNAVDWMPLVSGSTRHKLTQEDMMRVQIPYLSLDEQRAIADYLDVETGRIDVLISKTHRTIELLGERRQALITAAVIGQLAIPGVAA